VFWAVQWALPSSAPLHSSLSPDPICWHTLSPWWSCASMAHHPSPLQLCAAGMRLNRILLLLNWISLRIDGDPAFGTLIDLEAQHIPIIYIGIYTFSKERTYIFLRPNSKRATSVCHPSVRTALWLILRPTCLGGCFCLLSGKYRCASRTVQLRALGRVILLLLAMEAVNSFNFTKQNVCVLCRRWRCPRYKIRMHIQIYQRFRIRQSGW